MLRRFLSILLLAFFALPLVSPLFAMSADAGAFVPACCRRGGAHHCMQNMAEAARASSRGPAIAAPVLKCPYSHLAIANTYPNNAMPAPATILLASLASYYAGLAQTQSRWRIARDRSRQKRGPPSLLS